MKLFLSILLLLITSFTIVYTQDKAIGEGISYVGTLSSITTSVEELPEIPIEFKLYQNYPNPFNPTTKIKYSIIEPSFVTLKVYDVSGRIITSFVNNDQTEGVYEVTLKAKNLSSGVYLYVLEAGGKMASNKMNYLK